MSLTQRLGRLADRDRAAAEWLLSSDEPAVRQLVMRDILGLPAGHAAVRAARGEVFDGPRVRRLLDGQTDDGGFGAGAYAKWHGTHWRLLALTELGVPADERSCRAFEHELAWLRAPGRLRRKGPVEGRYRRCASQEGAALAVGVHLGLTGDERLMAVASDLVEWQWPDGGWNCDVRPEAGHSSFHESLKPLWALDAFSRVTGDAPAKQAADRAAEFFLRHRLYRSERTGEPYPKLTRLRFPAYWHYDLLDGLLVLARGGRVGDPRAADALAELERQRLPDGRWAVRGSWWRPPGAARSAEVVDWGRRGPNEFVTLNALRVLGAAGQLGADVHA